jgi:signal transduction histidine kinase
VTLTDAQRIRFGRVIAASAVVMSIGGLAVAVLAGRWDAAWETLTPVNALIGVGFGALGWTILPRQPRNRSMWAYAVAAFFGGLYSTALAVLVLSIPKSAEASEETLIPADLDWPAAISATTLSAGWIPSFLLPLTIGLLLFPNGRVPSLRWRWALRFQATTLSLAFLLATAANNPWSTRPIPNPGGTLGTYAEVFITLALLSALLGIASLVARYRSGDAIIRYQIRWIAFGGALLIFMELTKRVLWGGLAGSMDPTVENLTNLVPLVLLIGSFWVAIAKYRLYDIDVIISKSVTYVGLGAVISGLYVAVVVGPLLVIGESDDGGPGLLLPIVATAVVAVVFEPVRVRMQRRANRLVYGDRATPHEVLSQMTARLADARAGAETDDLARLLADGTGADQAVVWIRSGESLRPEGMWSRDGLESDMSLTTDGLDDDEFTELVPVRHEDVELGALSIAKPQNDPVTHADRELLADVAAGAALVLRNKRLNDELEERATEVRESRRRLIAAQDAERHRLERDLHDGAQQQVVALKVKLGIAKTLAQREGADEIATRVTALADETQNAVDDLRAVAHGIYPPLLESEGLGPALRAVERSSALPVELVVSGLDRYTRPAEETVYFCVIETLEKARMSGVTGAHVAVVGRNGDLRAEIYLQGSDADLELTAVADRLDAAGGTFTIEDQPNLGHHIVGSLPLIESETVPA